MLNNLAHPPSNVFVINPLIMAIFKQELIWMNLTAEEIGFNFYFLYAISSQKRKSY